VALAVYFQRIGTTEYDNESRGLTKYGQVIHSELKTIAPGIPNVYHGDPTANQEAVS
jgi:hypothetical protein